MIMTAKDSTLTKTQARFWFRLPELSVVHEQYPSLCDNPDAAWFYIDYQCQAFDYYAASDRLKTIVGSVIWEHLRSLKVEFDGQERVELSPNQIQASFQLLLTTGAKFVPTKTEP